MNGTPKREHLKVLRRAPAVNTLRHLFPALGCDDLEAAFRRHAGDLNAQSTPEALRTIAFDGKTLRGSVEPSGSPDFDHLTDRRRSTCSARSPATPP